MCWVLIACGGSSSSSLSSQAKDFNKTTAIAALRASFLSIPANVQLTSVASSGKKYSELIPEDGLGGNVYGNINSNIKLAELIRGNLQGFFESTIEERDLEKVALGTLIEPDAGTITGYQLDDISNVEGESYKWKLSFYYFFSQTPDIICRFTFENGKMKGQMLQSLKDTIKITVNGFDHTVYYYYTFDIRFDGISAIKSLTINHIIDLSNAINFANKYWFQLTDEQKDELKIGQIGKSSLSVQYDGAEYGISGTCYAPGSNTEAVLRRQVKLFGEDRSTYCYRAKSITGDVDGAKMEVAMPLDTLENVDNIWEEDSFATRFETEITDFLNSYITQLIDEVDDEFINIRDYLGTALLESVDFDGDIATEKQIGFTVLYSYLGSNLAIPSLTTHGNTFTTEEFDSASTFWSGGFLSDYSIDTLDSLNAYMADTSNTTADKNNVYYKVMAPTVVTYYQSNPTGITLDHVQTVLETINTHRSISLNELIDTNRLIINPAFFEKDAGLLGTYDGETFNVYDWYKDTLVPGETPASIATLDQLDLTDLTTPLPNDIYNLAIEVK